MELGGKAPLAAKTLREARKQVEEHRELKPRGELGLAPFHERNPQPETGRQPVCRICHPALPHRSSPRKRSFLNMHTRYVACETCHFRPRGVTFDYRWLRYADQRESGEEAARPRPVPSLQGGEKVPSIVPDAVSRLAPFFQGRPALLFKEDPAAQEIARRWEQGSDEDKARLKAGLHRALKKEGRRCADCHSRRQDLLDGKRLGASARQIRAIEENAIARFFARYKRKTQRLRMTELLR